MLYTYLEIYFFRNHFLDYEKTYFVLKVPLTIEMCVYTQEWSMGH